MKKTRLTFIFALLATAGAWAQTFTVDNLKYTVADADAGTVELIGYKEQPTGKLVIPSTVTCDGTDYSVTRIGNEAFGFCYNLTGITIPEGVTHMGFGAFQYCTSLEQVAIPEGVTSIENWTFGYCSTLTEMTIPGSVTSIGDNAFYKCVSLNQVTIPESVTSFGKDAFRSCTLLTQMTIPDGVTSIGEGAFRGCTSLTQMIIPNSVTSIGNWTFEGCTSLKQVSISSAVSSIGYGTFQSCPALEQMTIPDAVTSIGKYAFLDCSALAQVTMGSGVRSLEEGAFLRCSALMRMTVRAAVPPTVAANTFKNVSRTIPVYVPVESLDAYKAADVWKEFRVKGLPFVVDNLEYCVTDNTAKTAEVIGYVSQPTGTLEIPAYVTYEDAAYSVTDIGDKAFYKSSSFEEVIFSDNVANIGENAFGGCSALMRMTVRAAVPPTVGTMAFKDVSRTIPVYVPVESLDAYKAADVWKGFRVKGLPFIVDNLKYCVTDNTAKTAEVIGYVSQPTGTLEIPAYVTYEDAAYSVTDIGDKAFYKSSSFEEVIFSDNVANIGENAFGGCSALMRMTVRAAVPPTVGTMAFEDVSRTIPVYVPAESLDAYQAAYIWKDFTALKAIGSTGLDTPSMPESISIYGGMLHNPEGLRVTLYDLAGRIAYDGRAAIVELPAGVYVVRCNGATGKAVF